MRILLLFGMLFTLPSGSLEALGAERPVVVKAGALNVRTVGGAILCAVPRGTEATAVQRHSDGQRVLVRFANPPRGCPAQGIVYSDYLTVRELPTEAAEMASVDINGLALRSEPRTSNDTFRCSLSRGTRVTVVDQDAGAADEVTWTKVQLTPARSGCPSEGYVAKFYLRGVNSFIDLPLIAGSREAPEENCASCGVARPAGASQQLERVSQGVGNSIRDVNAPRTVVNPKMLRLTEEGRKAAARCRRHASIACNRMGMSFPCGSNCSLTQSKGWCKAAVREAAQAALGLTIPGNSAVEARPFLERNMLKVKVNSCALAPKGSICLYDQLPGHNYGHIEIKSEDNLYCSDYCSARPLRNGRFLGAYIP